MESLPESSVAKRAQACKIPWNFLFIWREECWVRQISPGQSEVLLWVAELDVCRSAVRVPCQKGFVNHYLILYLFNLCNLEQPQSKPASLTGRGNTSSVFLWRMKGVAGFSPQIFQDIFTIPEVGSAMAKLCLHYTALCSECPLCPAGINTDVLGVHGDAQVMQKTGFHFNHLQTMGRGLKCHTLVNLCSSIGFYSSRFNDMPVYISYT